MEHINRIELQGRVGTVRTNTFNGTLVANFSLATDFLYKNRDGSGVSETTWHNVVAWSRKGMPDFEKIRKGTFLEVMGRIKYVKYTDSAGMERTATEINASKIIIPLEE